MKYNIDAINEYITKKIPVPVRDFTADPRLIVIRSFDINKPGADVTQLQGGVAGGSILKGVLKIGDEIEVRPGVIIKDQEGKIRARPILSKILTLAAETNKLDFAVPGGLIGKYIYGINMYIEMELWKHAYFKEGCKEVITNQLVFSRT